MCCIRRENFSCETEYVMAVHGVCTNVITPMQSFQCGACGVKNLVSREESRVVCSKHQPLIISQQDVNSKICHICVDGKSSTQKIPTSCSRSYSVGYSMGYDRGHTDASFRRNRSSSTSNDVAKTSDVVMCAIILCLSICSATIVICGIIASK